MLERSSIKKRYFLDESEGGNLLRSIAVDHVALRFIGDGVSPSTTRCRELATVISAVEDLILSLAEESEAEDIDVPLCLVALEDKSLGLKFAATQIVMTMALWQEFAAVINTGNFERLSPKAMHSVEEVVSFVKKKHCLALVEDSQNGVIASFDYNIALPVGQKLRGHSSLIGQVIRVGGEEPKIRLKLPSGRVVSCETTQEIAKNLGHRLYDSVTCKGNAIWDYTTGEVLKFRIDEVGAFRMTSASEAFHALAEAMPAVIAGWEKEARS